jgi:hypothetical protein
MTDYHDLVIEPLNSMHSRPDFQCGVTSLDNYLKKQAKQDVKRRISRVFVAITPKSPATVVGYYTLSTLSNSTIYQGMPHANYPGIRFQLHRLVDWLCVNKHRDIVAKCCWGTIR